MNPPACIAKGLYLSLADDCDKTASTQPGFEKVAYYCRTASIDKIVNTLATVPANEMPAVEAFLTQLITRCESDKIALYGTPEPSPDAKENDLNIILNYAFKFFTLADNADRALAADKSTFQFFKRSYDLFNVWKLSGGEAAEKTESMIKYAAVRASKISDDIRNNRPIAPPPNTNGANIDVDAELAALNTTTTTTTTTTTNNNNNNIINNNATANSSNSIGMLPPAAPVQYNSPTNVITPPTYVPSTNYNNNNNAGYLPGNISNNAGNISNNAGNGAGAYSYGTTLPSNNNVNAHSNPAPAITNNTRTYTPPTPTYGGKSGSKKGTSGIPADRLNDALELAKHAVAAIKEEDIEIAVTYLRDTLTLLGR